MLQPRRPSSGFVLAVDQHTSCGVQSEPVDGAMRAQEALGSCLSGDARVRLAPMFPSPSVDPCGASFSEDSKGCILRCSYTRWDFTAIPTLSLTNRSLQSMRARKLFFKRRIRTLPSPSLRQPVRTKAFWREHLAQTSRELKDA